VTITERVRQERPLSYKSGGSSGADVPEVTPFTYPTTVVDAIFTKARPRFLSRATAVDMSPSTYQSHGMEGKAERKKDFIAYCRRVFSACGRCMMNASDCVAVTWGLHRQCD
jgi:hypothetical protein